MFWHAHHLQTSWNGVSFVLPYILGMLFLFLGAPPPRAPGGESACV